MHFANWRLFYEEIRKMLLVPEKSSLDREFRKMEVRLYCILSLSSLHLRHWVDRNTLKKLKVARTLEKSAHPWYRAMVGQLLERRTKLTLHKVTISIPSKKLRAFEDFSSSVIHNAQEQPTSKYYNVGIRGGLSLLVVPGSISLEAQELKS
ncbi:hypothetical protein TNCV_586701 [Trichonephila clavipes]|nr:hypothetical protein TNCV_586701 [Trichonephila clavipes]